MPRKNSVDTPDFHWSVHRKNGASRRAQGRKGEKSDFFSILLLRCEDAVDESVLCQLRRRVKIKLCHDLRFMKFDGLR